LQPYEESSNSVRKIVLLDFSILPYVGSKLIWLDDSKQIPDILPYETIEIEWTTPLAAQKTSYKVTARGTTNYKKWMKHEGIVIREDKTLPKKKEPPSIDGFLLCEGPESEEESTNDPTDFEVGQMEYLKSLQHEQHHSKRKATNANQY
jgi:hypothetical protein